MSVKLLPHLKFEIRERGRRRPLKKGLIPVSNRRIFVGAGADNSIVVAAPQVPKRFLIMEPKDKEKFYFYFADSMKGLVVRDGVVLRLEELVAKGIAEKVKDFYRVELDINDEAKLQWGAVELWMKLALPLPKELKRKVDWSFELPFIIAVFLSLVVHVSIIYYFNTREVEEGIAIKPPEYDVAQIAPEQMQIPEELQKKEAEVKPAEKKVEKKGGKGKGKGKGTGKGPASKGILAVLTSKGKKSGVVRDLLTSGFDEDLAETLGSVAGVEVARSGLKGTRSGGGGDGGPSTVDLGELGSLGVGERRELEEIKKVKVKPQIGTSTPEVLGELDREVIAAKVKQYIGGIRSCYERQLKLNPQLQGKVTVRFTIGIDGRVTSVEIISSTLNSPEVESCIKRRIRRLRFPPPKEGEVVVTYPFVFTVVSR